MTALAKADEGLRGTDRALEEFFDSGTAHILTDGHRRLWSALRDATEGGKRLRPRLFHSVYRALGGVDGRAAGHVGAALELLHTALVIHDDVIDGDGMRRGKPNVSGTFAAEATDLGRPAGRAGAYGDAAAILAGDLALAGAVRLIARCGADGATTAELLDALDEALHQSAAGELADVFLSLVADGDVEGTLTMERHKTAAYSFELPLRSAAVLAGAAAQVRTALEDYARYVGIAYQLRDDVSGVFGLEQETGKSVLSDLREGKFTPLIAFARTTSQWPLIAPYLGVEGLTAHEAGHVRELLELCGARAFVEELARDFASRARRSARDLSIAPLLEDWIRAAGVDA
ncbi:polyprenyl synthetase family protein [Pseudactinotalea sp. HY158]|uniref:polyprenyl synthetase family protein n=1 Tax=Pseudactinotalea sp. HY158 TaxID=2654547 RepID=UPI0018922F7C|nr:polyprenyl synthetase family protein [Pseudactinotalea sp. HY158]